MAFWLLNRLFTEIIALQVDVYPSNERARPYDRWNKTVQVGDEAFRNRSLIDHACSLKSIAEFYWLLPSGVSQGILLLLIHQSTREAAMKSS